MKKKYVYEKGVIYITNKSINYQLIHNSTEKFLKRVLKEKIQNGNCN